MVKPDVIARDFSRDEIETIVRILVANSDVRVTHYMYLFGGLSTTTIRVDFQDGQKAILKVFFPNDPGIESIQNAMDICQYIHAHCASLPITHPLGDGVVRLVELEKFSAPCILMNYIDNSIAADRAGVDRWRVMAELGTALSNLHRIPVPSPCSLMTYEQSGAVDLAKHARGDFVDAIAKKGNSEFAKLYANMIASYFKNIGSSKLGIIHGDPFLDNVLLDKSTLRLAGLVDFEDACIGPVLFDIGSAIAGNCFDSTYRLDRESVSAFLGAYRLSSDEELEYIPRFIRMALTCNTAFRFLTFYGTGNNDDTYLELKHKLDHMLQDADSIREYFRSLSTD
jgi:aminoglycoside phosphotransferase (APT) family kinase protein